MKKPATSRGLSLIRSFAPSPRMLRGMRGDFPSFPLSRESICAMAASGPTPDNNSQVRHVVFLRRAVPLILSVLLFLLLPATLAAAEGIITGTVVNGTEGGSVPADVAVTLYFLRDGQIVEQRKEVTDAAGAYRFSEVTIDPALQFVVVAAYTDVPYNTPEMQFGDSAAITAPPLIVYEATQDPAVVRVITDVLIIAPGEERSGMLSVIEIVSLSNQSDRTYLATGVAGGGAAMDRVLRFALPPNAQDLTMLSGLNAQSVVQIDRGFGVFMPLLPGEREVAFGYQLPYSGSTLALTKRTVYPTEQFAIFTLEEHALQLDTDQLEVQVSEISGRRWVVGSTKSLAARAEVTARITGLPTPSWRVQIERLLDRIQGAQASLFVLLGVVFALPILYALYRMRGGPRQRRESPPAAAAPAPASGQALLLEIAQLDDDFAAGALNEDRYKRLRAEKKQRLIELQQAPDIESDEA